MTYVTYDNLESGDSYLKKRGTRWQTLCYWCEHWSSVYDIATE